MVGQGNQGMSDGTLSRPLDSPGTPSIPDLKADRWGAFPLAIMIMGLLGYLFAVRLPSLGSDVRLYAAFGDYFNSYGSLPAADTVVGSDSFASTYADFPALSLRVYQALALFGEEPNRFVWAAYFLVPLTIVMALVSVHGRRIGLNRLTARTLALVGMLMGIWTARFYEDKAHFLWLPLLVFLLAAVSPMAAAITTGVFSGWTGLLPLGPLLSATRQSRRRVLLFVVSTLSALIVLLAAGTASIGLLQNRAAREDGETFWFGFWRYLPIVDQSQFRLGFAVAMSIVALLAFQRRWLSLPAAFSASAFFFVTASSSFQHTRIWMLLPLAVFLLPTVRWQVGYLAVLAAWSCIPLIDFLGYGYFFAGAGLNSNQVTLLAIFTNVPVIFFFGSFVFSVYRGFRLQLGGVAGLFEPNTFSVTQKREYDGRAAAIPPPLGG